jgi:hypothetical protein
MKTTELIDDMLDNYREQIKSLEQLKRALAHEEQKKVDAFKTVEKERDNLKIALAMWVED